MQSFVSKSSIKAHYRKAVVASVIAVIVCSGLGLAKNGDTARRQPDSERPVTQVENRFNAATSRFAFKLYDQILKQRTTKNTFVSPSSIMLALAMTYNGADGTTRQGMARALELEGMSVDEVNRAFADLKTALAPADPKIKLNIANSIWARDGFTMKPEFIKRSKDNFDAEISTLDFANPEASEMINAWVSKNTQGKIQKIIGKISPEKVLYLINAIYFKGQWQSEFKKENTKPDVFKVSGEERKELPMMAQSGSYLYYRGKGFQSVALPYGKGSVSMYVFLPDEETNLAQFERSLTAENWETWMRSFRMTPGDVQLPRFKIEWESSLNEALQALGMTEAFNPLGANFSQMADVSRGNNLYISEVKHKSWCEVNEEGTEAAAVTSVGVGITSVQVPRERFFMKVDRPFFFAIHDNRTRVVLFMGSVANPG